MNDRFKFRVPVFYDGKFKAFKKYSICNGVIVWEEPETIGELWIEDELKRNNPHLKFGSDEQCTGLKDKNGKLIYENDIVEYKISGSPSKSKDVVSYDEKQCVWLKGYNFLSTYPKTIEIIGNIHENTELLK